MKPIEVLNHLSKVCVKNQDGSLTLGTYEVGLIEEAIAEDYPIYGGWTAQDVVDVGSSLGYEIPLEEAGWVMESIASKTCEITWDLIEYYITSDTSLDVFKVDNETVGNIRTDEEA